MILYFMNQREAIRHLVQIRRDALAKPSSDVIVKTHLHESPGVEGVERVLLDVRAARTAYFVECGSKSEDRIVFIT
ncbi:hypothetical protein ABH944_002059 [Caballeronia udeis]|uniref:Uncharacterized protein n=1 Tax=Caballeronia udeis TaxID=1232866 RepID=A0ABW8MK84_9BURK